MKMITNKKMILMERAIDSMSFEALVPLRFDITTEMHGGGRQEGNRYRDFESQSRTSDYDIIKVITLFRSLIAKLLFLGTIEERVPFVIDSIEAGFGFPVVPIRHKNKIGHWYLEIPTVVRHTSIKPKFNARPGQLVLKDGGKMEIVK
jgi:hypothetical protein